VGNDPWIFDLYQKRTLWRSFSALVIIVLFVLPYFFRPAPGDPEPAVYEKVKEAIRELDSGKDSSHGSVAHNRYHEPKNFTGNKQG
jgi:hypothetical protein